MSADPLYRAMLADGIITETPEPAPSPWRPIESAPKSGAVLVTFNAADIPKDSETQPGIMVAYWDPYNAPGGMGHDGIGDGWTDASSGQGCHLYHGLPTHWMPLPERPSC